MKNRKTLRSLSIILFAINFFFSLSAQKTITGKIIYQDGEPQIGASIWPLDADKNTIKENGQSIGTYNDYDGNYSLTIPDHARYFATSYEGTFNVTFPIPADNILNIINADVSPTFYLPKSRDDFDSKRTFPVLVKGVIYLLGIENFLPAKYIDIEHIAADGTVLQSTTIDEKGHFSMEIPPGSDILKVRHDGNPDRYFNIGTTSTIFIPIGIYHYYLSKEEKRALKRIFKNQKRRKKKN